MTESLSIDEFKRISDDGSDSVVLKGTLALSQSPSSNSQIPFQIVFSNPSVNQLRFCATIHDPDMRYKKIFLRLSSNENERIFGLGEQLTHWDLKGHKVPIMTREDGVGRGKQPTTFLANTLFGTAAGGDDVSHLNICIV
jgi:hypothetical protein